MNKQLPEGWKWVKLGDVAEITSSRRIFQNDYTNIGIPFFRTKEIKELNEGKEISIELFIGVEKYNEIKNKNEIPKIDDILISAVGTIGVSYIIKDTKPFYFKDGNLIWIRKLKKINSKFLHYNFVHYIRFKQEILTSGSAYNALTIIKLKSYDILLPPLRTQQAIVSKIEELFSDLDKGIENLKTAQSQLKVYRQSVLKCAFEGKLTSLNHDSLVSLDDLNLNQAAEPLEVYQSTKDQVIDNDALPEGWKWVKLGEIANLSNLKHTPSIIENKFYVGLEHIEKETGKLLPHVGMELIKTVKNVFSNGNILYGKLRPYLNKVYLTKENGVCSTDILVFKILDACNQKYLLQLMLSKPFVNDMSNNTSGVNLPRVSTKYILNYKIPLPSVEEQNQIVQEIESRFSIADKMEETIQQSLLQAESLRQSILKKAFEGELVK